MRQSGSLYSFFINHHDRLSKKFNFLITKQKSDVKNVKPIQYYCNFSPTTKTSEDHKYHFSFKLLDGSSAGSGSQITVKINPDSYDDTQQSISNINKKWFINLSSTVIPTDIQRLIQLDENFSLPVVNTNKLTVEFIKNIENNIRKLHSKTQIIISNRSTHIVNNLPSYFTPKCEFNSNKHLILATKRFFNNNHNLILTRVDKGNATVAHSQKGFLITGQKIFLTYLIASQSHVV